MVDVFEEVEEQLRSDRYRTLMRRWLPWVAGILVAALAAALGYWGWESMQHRAAEKASQDYSTAYEAQQKGDTAKAFSGFEAISRSGPPIYKSLALMNMGGMRLDAGEAGEAVKYFDQAAAAAPSEVVGDVARLKSAYALLDTAPYKETEARLMPLTGEKRPYRIQAKEALAYARLMNGADKDARRDFVTLQTMLGVPQGVQERASIAIKMIDSGAAKTLPAAVKAALALPPPQQMPSDLQLSPQGQ